MRREWGKENTGRDSIANLCFICSIELVASLVLGIDGPCHEMVIITFLNHIFSVVCPVVNILILI